MTLRGLQTARKGLNWGSDSSRTVITLSGSEKSVGKKGVDKCLQLSGKNIQLVRTLDLPSLKENASVYCDVMGLNMNTYLLYAHALGMYLM